MAARKKLPRRRKALCRTIAKIEAGKESEVLFDPLPDRMSPQERAELPDSWTEAGMLARLDHAWSTVPTYATGTSSRPLRFVQGH